jgi:hypothetical protein
MNEETGNEGIVIFIMKYLSELNSAVMLTCLAPSTAFEQMQGVMWMLEVD